MREAITRLLNSEVWGVEANKNLWKLITDDEFECEAIREKMLDIPKEVRVEAQQIARAELVGWVREAVAEDDNLSEFDVRDRFAVRYWNRVAELLGMVELLPEPTAEETMVLRELEQKIGNGAKLIGTQISPTLTAVKMVTGTGNWTSLETLGTGHTLQEAAASAWNRWNGGCQ